MSTATRISYAIILLIFVGIAVLHLPTLFLTLCFTSFILHWLPHFGGRRQWTVTLFLCILTGFGVLSFYLLRNAYQEVPKLVQTLIPALINVAQRNEIELPFSDLSNFHDFVREQISERILGLGTFAKDFGMEIAEFVIGIVAAVSLYVDSRFSLDKETHSTSVYTTVWMEVMERFKIFFRSFSTVMGAQVVISLINTLFTAVFLLWQGFPYPFVIIPLTFLCGLLPIVGNLMSNTVIVSVGLTLSPKMALFALAFLVVLHKLEYFLNSKIIGAHIKNPMWLTILGLLVGEALMGLPGMVMAPVILYYVKVEATRMRFASSGFVTSEKDEEAKSEK
jgi:predicted PurR-regulated permease PerM